MSDTEQQPSCEEKKPIVLANLNKQLAALGDEGICTMLDIVRTSDTPDADLTKLQEEKGLSSEEIKAMTAKARELATSCPSHYDAVLDASLPRIQQARDNTQNCKAR